MAAEKEARRPAHTPAEAQAIVSVPYREDPDQAYHDIRGWLLAAE